MSKHILIIEDERDYAQMLETRLTAHGYKCHVAGSAEEGLQKAKDFTPDLILLDLMLPNMNGLSFLLAIKKDKLIGKIPVVMLTALADEEIARAGLDFGAAGYLRKTCGVRELMHMVKSYAKSPLNPKDIEVKASPNW